jgi:hypothetical protein
MVRFGLCLPIVTFDKFNIQQYLLLREHSWRDSSSLKTTSSNLRRSTPLGQLCISINRTAGYVSLSYLYFTQLINISQRSGHPLLELPLSSSLLNSDPIHVSQHLHRPQCILTILRPPNHPQFPVNLGAFPAEVNPAR